MRYLNGGLAVAHSKVIVVSDDHEVIQKARNFAYQAGLTLEVFSISQWEEENRGKGSFHKIPPGQGMRNNIIAFPSHQTADHKKVKTINELESVAIENAIHEYFGNLTEAAKALGIGRATLYRKVKQYNINTSLARRKKAA